MASRGSYRLEKHHDPGRARSSASTSRPAETASRRRSLALVSVEKVFRLYRDPSATAKDTVLVDQKIDAFLEKHFDQYRLYCSDKRPYADHENPGLPPLRGIKEDAQYDDLTILGIRRK